MPAYPMPACGVSEGSESELRDGLRMAEAQDGGLTGFSLWPAAKVEFNLIHASVSTAERNAIVSQYNATRESGDVQLTWVDATVYTCRYLEPPSYRPQQGGRWRMTVRLREE